MIFQPVDPFPDPVHAGQEIEFVGLMFLEFSLFISMIILMIYLYIKIRNVLPIIVNYSFSILIAMLTFSDNLFPLFPYIQIWFILIQTSFVIMSALDYKNKKEN